MRGVEFDVEVSGDKELDRALRSLYEEARAPQRAWPPLNSILQQSVARQMNSQGSQSGGWPALSPAYAKQKAIDFPGQPMMRATGSLYRSLTDAFDSNAVFLIRPTEMVRGTRLPYAKYAAARRPVFALTAADKQQMEAEARSVFLKVGQSLGFEVS